MTNGIWTEDEHDRFLVFPRGPRAAIAQTVGTRSVRQVQTHTQKYYEKIMRRVCGLRKDRKAWARVEHRIDKEIFEFCNQIKAQGITSVVSPPNVMQKQIDSSFVFTASNSESSSSSIDCSSVSTLTEDELNQVDDFKLLDQTLDFIGQELPPLEEALDFLIALME